MKSSLWREHVLPFTLLLGLLAAATLTGDYVLHRFNLVWVGRYMGIPGTLLIIGSLYYSLRKRKYVSAGDPKTVLKMHEFGTWLGSLMVLIHAGIHFNAILGWLAVWAMLINVGSGLTGKYLLERSRKRLEAERQKLKDEGLTAGQLEERLHLDSLTFDIVKQWRSVHFPITLAFAVLALAHIISVSIFWGWK